MAATREHDDVLASYVQRLRELPAARWTQPRGDGKWSPAQEALHVVMAYEAGVAACTGGAGMVLVTSPAVAWLSRTFLLPLILWLRTFPRNAPAPREVRPSADVAAAISREEMVARLGATADRALRELREADVRRPRVRVMHAYFGPLSPLTAFRLLIAHTRHHSQRVLRENAR